MQSCKRQHNSIMYMNVNINLHINIKMYIQYLHKIAKLLYVYIYSTLQ